MQAGDICPECELIGLPGALCPKHAATDELLAACKLAKQRLDQMGMDWLGKGPDPLEAAIARAEGRA